MQATITGLYAGLIALLVIALSARVSQLRLKYRVGIGDGDHKQLARAIRVQANAVEYAPLGLLLLLLAEVNDFPAWLLHIAGSALFLGRILHAAGLALHAGTSPGRFLGTSLTWLMIGGLGLALLGTALSRQLLS